jgi:hypothetical protein
MPHDMIIRSYWRVRLYVGEPGQKIAVIRERPDSKEEEHIIDPEVETVAALMKRFQLPD